MVLNEPQGINFTYSRLLIGLLGSCRIFCLLNENKKLTSTLILFCDSYFEKQASFFVNLPVILFEAFIISSDLIMVGPSSL